MGKSKIVVVLDGKGFFFAYYVKIVYHIQNSKVFFYNPTKIILCHPK